ncbi:MAG: hypothetical protein ABI640_13100 [Gammaproteobacteria bacterium]
MRAFIWLLLIAVVLVAAATQITLFIVHPIGAAPEGRTLVIARLRKGRFIDSADAMCARTQAGVSLLCRAVMTAGVVNNAPILARLPYSRTLYLISTGGAEYGAP